MRLVEILWAQANSIATQGKAWAGLLLFDHLCERCGRLAGACVILQAMHRACHAADDDDRITILQRDSRLESVIWFAMWNG